MPTLATGWEAALHLVRLICESASYACVFLCMCCRSRCRLAAEIVALRSQVAACRDRVDRKQAPKPRFTAACRALWVVLSQLLTGGEDLAQLVKPATVKRWHNGGYRLWWRWEPRQRGRPSLEQEMRALIRKLSHKSPLWSAERIRDTLLLLGYPPICDDTVRKYMVKPRKPRKPSTTWLPFLRNHLFRDNDGIYGHGVALFLKSCGVREVRTALQSPWQSPNIERFIGTLRRELLNHVIAPSEAHLEQLLREFIEEYHHVARPHQGLRGETPMPSRSGSAAW